MQQDQPPATPLDALTELAQLPQWVVWRYEERDGRATKVPYDPKAPGRRASADNPSTWSTYEEAVTSSRDHSYSGVGFVFTRDDPYTGIDLDDCRDPDTGEIDGGAGEWIGKLSTYSEVSPSGTGVKCWVRGRVPRGIHPKGTGVFSERRYFCFTGEHVDGTPTTIEEGQEVLDELFAKLTEKTTGHVDRGNPLTWRSDNGGPAGPEAVRATRPQTLADTLSDRELIEKAFASRDGLKFQALWRGDTSDYASPSEADLALCSMLGFWTGGDPERVDRLFRRSGLYRAKWERPDYRDATIAKALDGKTELFGVLDDGLRGRGDDDLDPDPDPEPIEPFEPFPVDLLPGCVGEFVETSSEAISCDPSYVALPLLSALAAAIGNTRRIELKQGWTEPSVVWTSIVGESGTMKSPALEIALRPVRRRQHLAMKEYTEATNTYRNDRLTFERELARWKRGKEEGLPPAEPERPTVRRTWCDDSTIEALAVLLLENPRGLLMVRDELSGWLGGFDRYSQGRSGHEVAKWLEVFGGRPMVVDRKTGDPPTLYIPRAAVSVAGGIQPGVLARALTREFFENGLAARLLLAYPPRKPKRWTEAEIAPELEGKMDEVFHWLAALRVDEDEHGDPTPRIVKLSDAAKEAWVAFYNEHAEEQVDLEEDLAAAWSKLEGYAGRLALVIHLTRWAVKELPPGKELELEEETVQAGVKLARWFGWEARRIYRMLAESEEERGRRRLVELIERKGGEITATDLRRHDRRFRKSTEAATAALDELAAAELGEWVKVPPGPGGGRPSRVLRLRRDDPPF